MKSKQFLVSVLILAVSVLFSGKTFAAGRGDGMNELTLKNGLRVVLYESRRSKTVVFYLEVQGGIRAEGAKTGTGVSHFTEHLIAHHYGVWAKESGSSSNAFTAHDKIGYWLMTSSDYTGEAAAAFAESFTGRSFSDELFENEKRAGLNEVARRDGKPETKAWEIMLREAYGTHPYGQSVGGDPLLVPKMTKDEAVGYIRSRYVPAHMLLVVAGDFDTTAMAAKLEEHFGKLEAGPYVPVVVPAEPEQMRERVVVRETKDTHAYFSIGYKAVGLNHPDRPALDILASILSEGKASRLAQKLVDTGLAVSADAESWTPLDPGLFVFTGSAEPAKLDAALVELGLEAERIPGWVTDEDIKRVGTQYKIDDAKRKENMLSVAKFIAEYKMAFGTISGYENDLARYESVKVEDVIRVARVYLRPERRTKVVLLPEKAADAVKAVASKKDEPPFFKKEKLPTGLALLSRHDSSLPYGTLKLAIDVRAENPPPGAELVMAAQMFERGTEARTAEEFFRKLENAGGSFHAESGREYLTFSLYLPTRGFDVGLALFNEVMSRPRLTEEEFAKEKANQVGIFRQEEDEAWLHVSKVIRAKLFPGSAYGKVALADDIAAVTLPEVKAAISRFFCPERATIVWGGGFDPQLVKQFAETLFAGAECRESRAVAVPYASLLSDRAEIELPKPNNLVVLAFRLPLVFETAANENRGAVRVLSHVLARRIYDAARLKAGISYDQWAFNEVGKFGGFLAGYIEVKNRDDIEKAEKILRQQFARVSSELLTTVELEKVFKAQVIAADIRLDSTEAAVNYALSGEMMFGEGERAREAAMEALKLMTPEKMQDFAKEHLSEDKALLVIQRGVSK